jgi:beta-lactamase class A
VIVDSSGLNNDHLQEDHLQDGPGVEYVVLGYSLRLSSGQEVYANNQNAPFYAASLMKVALVLAVLRRIDDGTLRFEDELSVKRTFKSPVDSQIFRIEDDSCDSAFDPNVNSSLKLETILARTICVSSNEGANMLLDIVGFDEVNATYRACGAQNSFVHRHVYDEAARRAGRTNVITPGDATLVLHAIMTDSVVSNQSGFALRKWMREQQQRDLIPAALSTSARIGNKEGGTSQVLHDMAFVEQSDSTWCCLSVCTASDSESLAKKRIHETVKSVQSLHPEHFSQNDVRL